MATRRGPYICGIDAAMDVVSGKWKSLILWELHHYGTRRFAELRRGLPGVSEKMLIQHLREMEEDDLVHREVYAEVPPRVEYSLTEHGVSLNAALADLGAWYLIILGVLAIAITIRMPNGLWGWFTQRTGVSLFPVGRRLEVESPAAPGAAKE